MLYELVPNCGLVLKLVRYRISRALEALLLSKQNVCLMEDTNVTRPSASENRCKLCPPERKLTNQPSLNLEGAQGKI